MISLGASADEQHGGRSVPTFGLPPAWPGHILHTTTGYATLFGPDRAPMSDLFPFQLDSRPKRGFPLTFILLAIMFFSYLSSFTLFYILVTGQMPEGGAQANPRLIPYFAVLFLMSGTGALGMWLWRRWGLYLLTISLAAMLLIDFSLIGLAFYSIPVFLLILRIGRKRRHFE